MCIRDRYTIVGIGSSPYYLNFDKGSSTIGNGDIRGFVMVLPEEFKSDIYTQIYATCDSLKPYICLLYTSNFAHGDIIMVGSFAAYIAMISAGVSPIVSVLLAMVICTVLGLLIERIAYKPLRSAPSLAVLITAIGVSYFLQNMALLVFGSDTKTFPNVVSFGGISLAGGSLQISRCV